MKFHEYRKIIILFFINFSIILHIKNELILCFLLLLHKIFILKYNYKYNSEENEETICKQD